VFDDLYACPTDGRIHLDIIAPVINDNKKVIAAVVFRVNPKDYLYPLIQRWPLPSKTGESLLLRKEEKSVLFLNELRHRKHSALQLRIPLTERKVPAVQAALGYTGIWEGEDYRGISVLSFIQPISNTPWFMIAKIDQSEVFSELTFKASFVSIFTIALILMLSAAFAWFYNPRQKNIYEKLFIQEKELREEEEKISALFASMTEMVAIHEVIFNEQGEAVNYRIIDCNLAFTKITGIKKEDAIGRLATEVYQSELAPYLDVYSRVAVSGEPAEYTTYYAPMEKYFNISVVSPKKNQFATITTDITAIKQTQKIISDKNKELENYLYVSSHDLRSPLVNIQGFSQRLQKNVDAITAILNECSLEPEAKEKIAALTNEAIPKSLNFIFTNVSKMDVLINALLHISRTGRVKMTIAKVDMNQLIKEVTASLDFQLTELSAKITVQPLSDCFGDENLLNQLFTNIIGNAIKYRDTKRQLHIEISSEVKQHKVIYSVKDNGIGIAPRHLEKIWNVFYRVDSSSAKSGEGIGLSLVKIIAEKHYGKAWAKSEEGKGSAFAIELPTKEFTE